MAVKKTSTIQLKVGLDDQQIPVRIDWSAQNGEQPPTGKEAKAFLVSIFEKDSRDTLKMDLWVKDMQVNEMDRFFFQTLRGMADTYFKATQNKELATAMQQFVNYFGEETKLLDKTNSK